MTQIPAGLPSYGAGTDTCLTCPVRPSVMLALVLPQGPVAFPSSSVAAPQLALTWRAPRLSCASTASLSYGVLPAAAESLCVGALETWSWACSSAIGALGGADG